MPSRRPEPRFNNLSSDEVRQFDCVICEKLVREAARCTRSHHLFCRDCIECFLEINNITSFGGTEQQDQHQHQHHHQQQQQQQQQAPSSTISPSTSSASGLVASQSSTSTTATLSRRRGLFTSVFQRIHCAANNFRTAVADAIDVLAHRPSRCPLCHDRNDYQLSPATDDQLAVQSVTCPFVGKRGPCRWKGRYGEYVGHVHVYRSSRTAPRTASTRSSFRSIKRRSSTDSSGKRTVKKRRSCK